MSPIEPKNFRWGVYDEVDPTQPNPFREYIMKTMSAVEDEDEEGYDKAAKMLDAFLHPTNFTDFLIDLAWDQEAAMCFLSNVLIEVAKKRHEFST